MKALGLRAPAVVAVDAAAPVPLILVQHANQHIVTGGYESREDVFDLHRALGGLIQEHLASRVPLALHISGTMTVALAWHVPAFKHLVRRAVEEGLLELVGSAYAQNVMPLFTREHNRRQLAETLHLYRRHYGVDPERVRCLWVPERVWNTDAIAEVVTSPDLPNGGYRAVFLDDRHAYRTEADNGDGEVSRWSFDADSAPAAACRGDDVFASRPLPGGDGRHLRPYRIAGAEDLVVLPLSSELRYALPLHDGRQAEQLGRLLACARESGPDALLVFGDDAERSAGIGLWAPRPWHERGLAPYAATLTTLAGDPRVEVTLPSKWLACRAVTAVRPVDPGGFYELVTRQGAGDDYRGFWLAEEWRDCRQALEAVEALLCAGPAAPPPGGLWETAWHQLMVSSYETAWQEPDEHSRHRPAPWARATANHVREAYLLILGALHAERREEAQDHMSAQLGDVDGDGHDEVVLCNDAMFVVVSPRFGGRIVLACDLTSPGGRVVIGNVADDWNWQEQPHQFMARPRNHPGALADIGAENDAYAVVDLRVDSRGAALLLENVQAGSRLLGLRKCLRLAAGAASLEVEYLLPEGCGRVGVEFALCPDYLHLLREGRGSLVPVLQDTPSRRGFTAAQTAVWIDVAAGAPTVWDRPVEPECGHAGVLRLSAWGSFALTLNACDALVAHATHDIWPRPVLVGAPAHDPTSAEAAPAAVAR